MSEVNNGLSDFEYHVTHPNYANYITSKLIANNVVNGFVTDKTTVIEFDASLEKEIYQFFLTGKHFDIGYGVKDEHGHVVIKIDTVFAANEGYVLTVKEGTGLPGLLTINKVVTG